VRYLLVSKWREFPGPGDGRQFPYLNAAVHTTKRPPDDGVDTVFIRISGGDRPLSGWRGKVRGIRVEGDKTFFTPEISDAMDDAEVARFKNRGVGWYELSTSTGSPSVPTRPELVPALFDRLQITKDPDEFEELAYRAIRLLGIHRSYRFEKDDQAGKADGFFKFQNLAVIYDCTLRENFETHKRQQLQNYANQLLSGEVAIPPDTFERVCSQQKQVWVVTRGRSRVLYHISDVGSVTVKEVSVSELKKIFLERLLATMTEDDLENRFRSIGEI